MDETHLHPPQPITATISNEETPSFILQQSSSNGDQHQDYSSNQQTTPLLISQIYEKQFYDNVKTIIDLFPLTKHFFKYLVSYELLW